MNRIVLISLFLLFPTLAGADQYVSPHFRSNGAYVEGYYRSSPNGTTLDNYSHQGNINPYTGDKGYHTDTVQPYSLPSLNSYDYSPYRNNQ